MIVFDSHWMTLHWDEALKAPCTEMKGYAEGEEYRAGLGHVIALCRSKRPRRYVGDARYLAPISQADQRWTNEEYLPAIIAAGVRYVALVMPKASVARLSIRQVLSKINDVTLTTNYFDDLQAARDWLRSV